MIPLPELIFTLLIVVGVMFILWEFAKRRLK